MDKYEGVLSLTLLRLKISIQLIIDGTSYLLMFQSTLIKKRSKTTFLF